MFTTSMHNRHEQAVEIINRAIDLGVNYIDASALYGNGASELNIGTVMAVVGISDVAHLEENVRIACAFEQLSEQEMAEIRKVSMKHSTL